MVATNKQFPNEAFVEYLNTLHNVSANNQSAIAELSVTNPFFIKTMVKREVGNFITDTMEKKPAHIFVLTGHAGDGKTGLLYQTLRKWDAVSEGEGLELTDTVTMPNGKSCRYVKDFSELESSMRSECIRQAKDDCSAEMSTFLVANTGPLINSFKICFTEAAVSQLIESIDVNDGIERLYDGIPVVIINVATIDNSTFVRPYLSNLLSEDLWAPCHNCEKNSFCPIYSNYCLMERSSSRITDFVRMHYIFQQEQGKKLTIRQVVAHLGFTITGGLECHNIKNSENGRFTYLFTNSFFGYKGISINKKALPMKAIEYTVASAYDYKRLRANETLFIKGDLKSVFTPNVSEMLSNVGVQFHHSEEWQRAVKRAYMLLNIDTSETSWKNMLQDMFSTWFPRFLQLRSGESVTSSDKELVQDALQMIFTESIVGREKEIPVTMKRENGVSQCVHLVYDSIPKKKLKLGQVVAIDYNQIKRYQIYMSINGERINTCLTLPLFDYFEEIRKGAIATNIDPMLSQGIDSLKAQIISFCESDKAELELLALSNTSWDSITAEYVDGEWKIN